MKKIIIISYFFPPSNFVGGDRTLNWAKNLNKHNIYPIIITRRWNKNQTNLTDKIISNELLIEKKEGFEVHSLPYKQSLRDKLARFKKLKILQKTLTFIELILTNFFISALPYKNFYTYCDNLIENDNSIKYLIASGRPFKTFFIGSKLKKRHKSILWIPDYRDEWNTHQNKTRTGFILNLISKIEANKEINWTKNADYFISVSDNWVNSISKFIQKEGVEIRNGYEKLSGLNNRNNLDSVVRIVYAGTLYPSQDLTYFITGVNEILESNKKNIEIYFIGIEIVESEKNKIIQLTQKFNSHFFILDRMPKADLIKFYEKADLLLLTGFKNVKGWYPVKLFDYISLGKPILLCASDNDVIEKTIKDLQIGFIANSKNECTKIISDLMLKKLNGLSTFIEFDNKSIHKYSRNYHTNLLGEFLRDKLK